MINDVNKRSEVKLRAVAETKTTRGSGKSVKPNSAKVVRLRVEQKPKITIKSGTVEFKEQVTNNYESSESTWDKPVETKNNWLKILTIGTLLIVTAIVSVNIFKSRDITKNTSAISEKQEDLTITTPEDPAQWFKDHSYASHKEALKILNSFVSAGTDKERSFFVRRAGFYLKNSSQMKINMNPRVGPQDKQDWRINHTGDKAYLRLVCKDEDFKPFSAYFTREGESIKLDIEASSAWSEMSWKSKPLELNEGVSTMVRCLLSRNEEFYSGQYNDETHASYIIKSPDKTQSIWGYVKRGSALDGKLKALLDHGSFIVSLKENARVTINISSKGGVSLPVQVDILDLLHEEWVTP